jgi:hypothetical protein
MKSALSIIVALNLCFLSCEDISNPISLNETPPPDAELIWVGKEFSGGRQCTREIYTPPDTKKLLNQVGIAVYATYVEPRPVCMACSCPAYAALHSARIRRNQLSQAEALGFRQVEPPPGYSPYGKWNWLKSVGGIGGWTLTPPPIVRVEYERSGLFSYYRNDTLVATTRFVIRREKTFLSSDTCDVIHYQDSLRFVPQAFKVGIDTLKLTDLCVDCYGHAYKRIP